MSRRFSLPPDAQARLQMLQQIYRHQQPGMGEACDAAPGTTKATESVSNRSRRETPEVSSSHRF